jgi:O-antigen chain-terminating methyltransferase
VIRADLHATSDWVRPQGLPPTLEIAADPLTRPEDAAGSGNPLPPPDQRYAEFERVFYESPVVARKQRIYLPYVDRELAKRHPFLDLGCGRGEFMDILRGEGIRSVGVDLNPGNVAALRRAGHEVRDGDLLAFLERDTGTYSGAVCLQVVEHLPAVQFERLLELLHPRLAPGAVLVIESVNPHSPFALGNFHMDPTHVAPVPPERVRFYMELAGFVRTRTLLQAPIPGWAFGGPEPRAHYCDYAVIGYRS